MRNSTAISALRNPIQAVKTGNSRVRLFEINTNNSTVSCSRSKHERETSQDVCDRLGLTRADSQRQLPTDHDYAVSTREYQLDQSSPLPASAAADPVLEGEQQKQTHESVPLDRVTPYQCPLSCVRDRRCSVDASGSTTLIGCCFTKGRRGPKIGNKTKE